jgi:hypothetical protein
MSEVQAFLCVTFGSIWNRCTLGLQEAIRDSHTLRVLDVDYLRYKLEAEMALFGTRIKKAAGAFADRAGYWVGQFAKMLSNYVATADTAESIQVKMLVFNNRRVKTKTASSAVMPPPATVQPKLSPSNNIKKELCIRYMRHAFNVVNPATNLVYDSCVKADCERYHNQIFEKSKQAVLQALGELKGAATTHKALVEAVAADSRLK